MTAKPHPAAKRRSNDRFLPRSNDRASHRQNNTDARRSGGRRRRRRRSNGHVPPPETRRAAKRRSSAAPSPRACGGGACSTSACSPPPVSASAAAEAKHVAWCASSPPGEHDAERELRHMTSWVSYDDAWRRLPCASSPPAAPRSTTQRNRPAVATWNECHNARQRNVM